MQKQYKLQYYLIVYLDLLNQSEMLDTLEKLPMSNPESFELHKDALKKTVGRVKDFHNAFMNSMEKLFLKLKPMYDDAKCIKRYSDSVIFYLPLEVFNNPLYSQLLLDGLCDFMFCTLSAGLPCRGAVEFGKAVEVEVNGNEIQLYGSVLSKAVKSEKNAEYPSILVSNEFVNDYVHPDHRSMYLIFDGKTFRINHISKSVQANIHFEKYYIRLKQFIDSSILEFKKSHNRKLLKRYRILDKRTLV